MGAGGAGELASLRQQWGYIEMLLRRPVATQSDLTKLAEGVRRGQHFTATLKRDAARLGMRRGALSRAVLRFDEQTSTLDQSNVAARRTALAPEAQALLSKGAMSSEQLSALTASATALRGFMRVKIADDADLDQAESALGDLDRFLSDLNDAARRNGQGSFGLLQQVAS